MRSPIELKYPLPKPGDAGYFGTVRRFDIHTGIDLYCDDGDSVHMRVKDAAEFFKGKILADKWFIRPEEDLKAFNGTVTEAEEIINWMKSPASGNFSFSEDTPIIIAPVKKLYSEARFFIVDGKVVDGSYYRFGGRTHTSHIDQQETIDMAQALADKWLPHECCVMDVADTDDGLKIIEWNTLNSSGFYAHDIRKIVYAITEWARKLPLSRTI